MTGIFDQVNLHDLISDVSLCPPPPPPPMTLNTFFKNVTDREMFDKDI